MVNKGNCAKTYCAQYMRICSTDFFLCYFIFSALELEVEGHYNWNLASFVVLVSVNNSHLQLLHKRKRKRSELGPMTNAPTLTEKIQKAT